MQKQSFLFSWDSKWPPCDKGLYSRLLRKPLEEKYANLCCTRGHFGPIMHINENSILVNSELRLLHFYLFDWLKNSDYEPIVGVLRHMENSAPSLKIFRTKFSTSSPL